MLCYNYSVYKANKDVCRYYYKFIVYRKEAWGYKMEGIREQKLEALKTAKDYLDRLIPAMEEVISEIKGEMKEDTVDFLLQIVDGFNFMIETYNVTRDIVNDPDPLINDDILEEAVKRLSDGFSKKDYVSTADELSNDIVPFLKVFKEAAAKAA